MTRRVALVALGVGLGAVATVLSLALRSLLARRARLSGLTEAAVGIDWAIGVAAMALALSVWLTLATFLQLVVDLWPVGRRWRSLADVVAPSSIRTLRRGVATAAMTVSFAVATPAPAPSAPVTRIEAAQASPPERARLSPRPSDAPPATAHLEPIVPSTTVPPTPRPAPVGLPPGLSAPAPVTGPEAVVQPGEDFWHIVEATVTATLGREPTERDVADYWLRLIAANHDRLVVAGNADLLYPGQVLRLPEVGGGVGPILPETL